MDPVSEHYLEALEILRSTPLIAYYQNKVDGRFAERNELVGHVDFPRLAAGRSGGAFWSAFMPHRTARQGPIAVGLDDLVCLRDTLQQIDLIHRLVERYRDHWQLVERAHDILDIFRQGKFACLIGVEGLHQLGGSHAALRMMHKLGVRYVTVTHSKHNIYADSEAETPPFHNGLSESGRAMIHEMNRVGMIIDLSHASARTIHDVFEISAAPVAFTHSSVKSLVRSERNVDDAMLEKLRQNRGIVMISFVPELTHEDPDQADLTHVVDHIVYVGTKIGYDWVGLGSDFDGMLRPVKGLEDVSKYPALVAEMLRRGLARPEVDKVLGLNIIRVLHEVEIYADRAAPSFDAAVDDVEPLWDASLLALTKSLYPTAA